MHNIQNQKFISETGSIATVLRVTCNGRLIHYRYEDSAMVYCALSHFWERFFTPIN